MGIPALVEAVNGSGGSSPQVRTFTGLSAVGDVLIVAFATAYQPTGTISVTGTLNGAFSPILTNYDAASTKYEYFYAIVVNTAGAETVTVTLAGTYWLICSATHWNNFTGTPAFDVSYPPYMGAANPVAGNPITNFNNEVLISNFVNGSYLPGVPAGWTGIDNWNSWYAGSSTAGTSIPFTQNLNTSGPWALLILGLYDSMGATLSPSPVSYTYSLGQVALSSAPNTFAISYGLNLRALSLVPVIPIATMYNFALSYGYSIAPSSSDRVLSLSANSYSLSLQPVGLSTVTTIILNLQALSYGLTLDPISLVATTGKMTMPNLIGVNYYEAILMLQEQGVYVPVPVYGFVPSSITIAWGTSPGYPTGGIVINQSIPAGSSVAVAAPITLTLSEFAVASVVDSPPDWSQTS